MLIDVMRVYKGLNILSNYLQRDSDIYFDTDAEILVVYVGIVLKPVDHALMHTYHWFSFLDGKRWRFNLDSSASHLGPHKREE